MQREETIIWLESLRADIENGVSELWNAIDSVSATFKQLKAKQPYHINVIDELHANENANSRILAKLFQFQNEAGQYEILQSFLNYLQNNSRSKEFSRISIDNPTITQEEERIDIWIRDTEYAIIMENKIYDANDQDAQLARYITKTENKGYPLVNIFVIYLPSSTYEPSEQTWILVDDKGNEHNYAPEFENRYLNLSFRDHIYPWLKHDIVPNVRQKDFYLLNALNQYVDYLEGMFYLRETDKKINMEIQELLIQKLELNKKPSLEEKYKVVNQKISDIRDIISQLEALRDNISRQKLDEIIERYDFAQNIDGWYPYWLIIIEGIEYKLCLGKDSSQPYYCQFERQDKNNFQGSELQIKLQQILPQTSSSQKYAIWKFTNDYYEILVILEKVFAILDPIIDKDN